MTATHHDPIISVSKCLEMWWNASTCVWRCVCLDVADLWTQAAQAISCLDVSGLRRVPGSSSTESTSKNFDSQSLTCGALWSIVEHCGALWSVDSTHRGTRWSLIQSLVLLGGWAVESLWRAGAELLFRCQRVHRHHPTAAIHSQLKGAAIYCCHQGLWKVRISDSNCDCCDNVTQTLISDKHARSWAWIIYIYNEYVYIYIIYTISDEKQKENKHQLWSPASQAVSLALWTYWWWHRWFAFALQHVASR
jgi:hypothetical protein